MNRSIAVGVLFLALSPAFAHQIRIDFDHGTNFTCYKTYSWVQSPEAWGGRQFPNQLTATRIARSIEEAMAARGIKLVAKGGDLLIDYRIDVTERPQFVTFSDGVGPVGFGWGNGFSTTTVEYIYDGTLIIDMIDARHSKLVFQGTSTQSISSRPEKNTKKLSKAVNEVLGRYPPQQ